MANIQEYLNKIKNAVYGKDVRQAIYDGIHQCYEDGKAGAIDLVAREDIEECEDDIKAINDDVTELKVLGWNVPSGMSVKNTVSGNTFTQKVGRVKLSDLGFGYASSLFQYSFAEAKKPSANNVVANIYTSKYKTVFYYSGGQGVSTNDKSIALDMNGKLYVKDSTYTDVTTFKNANNGTYLYYELATYKTFNIDGNEVSERIENDLSDYGLNNVFDGEFRQGGYYDDGIFRSANDRVTSVNAFSCSANNIVSVKCSKASTYQFAFFNGSTFLSRVISDSGTATAPTNTTSVYVTVCSSSSITPSQVGHVGVYVNNQIDVIKNNKGTVTINTTASNASQGGVNWYLHDGTVEFGKTFDSVPNVYVTLLNTSGNAAFPLVFGVTKTGFAYRIWSASKINSGSLQWFAVE